MADPTKYDPSFNFSGYQASNPSTPLPGPRVDIELQNLKQTTDQTIDALKSVRRSDGALANGIVTAESLAPSVLNGVIGPTGPTGPKGATGAGVPGVQGPQGNVGPQGPVGPTGSQGPQGVQGLEGQSFTPDAIGPSSAQATYNGQPQGFSFLDATNGLLYFKLSNTSADWSVGAMFGRGPQGPQGIQGVQGASGPQGAIGPTGPAVDIAATINTAIAKSTPADPDQLGIWDSVSNALRKVTWANLKAILLVYFVTKFPRVDAPQSFTGPEQGQARENIGAGIQDWNSIINGGIEVAERALPVVISPSTTAYGPDRFAVTTVAGISCSLTRVALPLGHAYGKYYLQATFSGTGASGSYARHKIAGVTTHADKAATLSFAIADNVATAGIVQMRQFFGTGGTPSAPVTVNTAINIGSGLALVKLLLAIPSIVGKTLGTNGDDYLEFLFIPTVANAHVLSMGRFCCLEGDHTAKTDPYPARDYLIEKGLCRRFARRMAFREAINATAVAQIAHGSTDISDMRVPPTISATATADTLTNTAVITVDTVTIGGSTVVRAFAGALASGLAAFSAERFLDAELY